MGKKKKSNKVSPDKEFEKNSYVPALWGERTICESCENHFVHLPKASDSVTKDAVLKLWQWKCWKNQSSGGDLFWVYESNVQRILRGSWVILNAIECFFKYIFTLK